MKKTLILSSMLTIALCLSCTKDNNDFLENESNIEETVNKLQPIKPVIAKFQGSCGVTEGNDRMPLSASQINELSNNFYPLPPINVTVQYHIVRNSAGNDGIPVSDLDVMTSKLNQDFSQALYSCVQFPIGPERLRFINGGNVNYIDNGTFYIIDDIDEFDTLIDENNVTDKLNIYIVKRFRRTNVIGRAKLPGNGAVLSRDGDAHLGTTFAHEVGHNFGLNHLSYNSLGLLCNYAEHNCSSTSGDLIADTPITLEILDDLIENCEINTNISHWTGCPPPKDVAQMSKFDILFSTKNMMTRILPEGPCREGFTGMQHLQMNQMAIDLGVGRE